jgi:hypothetical protein
VYTLSPSNGGPANQLYDARGEMQLAIPTCRLEFAWKTEHHAAVQAVSRSVGRSAGQLDSLLPKRNGRSLMDTSNVDSMSFPRHLCALPELSKAHIIQRPSI